MKLTPVLSNKKKNVTLRIKGGRSVRSKENSIISHVMIIIEVLCGYIMRRNI